MGAWRRAAWAVAGGLRTSQARKTREHAGTGGGARGRRAGSLTGRDGSFWTVGDEPGQRAKRSHWDSDAEWSVA